MNLAVTPNGSLSIKEFNMSTFFFTDSYLFKKLTLTNKQLYLLEIILASLMIVVLIPLFLAVALAIKLTMHGKVFYTQTRVGKEGKHFSIIKFRTMVEDAEVKTGPVLASKDDPRITRLGKFLRKSHIDELPQLFNIINGDMSFVGPRPERPVFVEQFEKEIPNYEKRKAVRPGITGLAQICLPYDATANEKIEYDLYFIEHQESVLFSLLISYYTALKMVMFFKH